MKSTSNTRYGRTLAAVLASACAGVALADIHGEHTWVGTSGWWDEPNNWMPAAQPGQDDHVYVVQSDGTDRLVRYYNTLNPSAELYILFVDATGPGNMTMEMYYFDHVLKSVVEDVGYSGRGNFNQYTGSNLYGQLSMGFMGSSQGTYTLSGGTLAGDTLSVGNFGAGTLIQSGGYNSVYTNVYLGQSSGAVGHVDLQAGSFYAVTAAVFVGYKSTATSEVVHTGGEFDSGPLHIAEYPGSSGRYSLSNNGTLTVVGDEFVGINGAGTLVQSGTSAHTVEGSAYVGYTSQGAILQSGGTNWIFDNLRLGWSYGGAGTYSLSGSGTLKATSAELGFDYGIGGMGSLLVGTTAGDAFASFSHEILINGNGTVTIGNSGAVHVSSIEGDSGLPGLYVALSGGTGSVTLLGQLSAPFEYVGAVGSGSLIHNAGTNQTDNLVVGSGTAGFGTYTMNSGTLNVSEMEDIGSNGNGTFLQTGGQHTVGNTLYLAYNPNSRGYYSMTGPSSSLSSLNTVIADDNNAVGTFTQGGGTNTVNQDLLLGGYHAGSRGTYQLDAGTLSVMRQEIIGIMGIGSFVQNGGAHSVGELLSIGSGVSGTFSKTAGSLTATSIYNNPNGVFLHSGGTLQVLNGFTNRGTAIIGGEQRWLAGATFNAQAGAATFNTDAGRWTPNALKVNASGGSLTFNSTQHLNMLSLGSSSPPVIVSSGGNKVLVVAQELRFDGGSLTPGARLDLTDNDMIDDSNVGNPLADVTALVKSGRAGGAWTGNGISSSAAAAHPSHSTSLGVLPGRTYMEANGTAFFSGEPIDADSVLIKYTWYGDTDLNGKVNFDDYVRTDFGFNNHRTGWFYGDFDYNGVVNFDDYVLIDLAFNTQSGTLRQALSLLDGGDGDPLDMGNPALRLVSGHFQQFGDSYARAFVAAVPEPAVVTCAGMLACGLTLCRRRRARLRSAAH